MCLLGEGGSYRILSGEKVWASDSGESYHINNIVAIGNRDKMMGEFVPEQHAEHIVAFVGAIDTGAHADEKFAILEGRIWLRCGQQPFGKFAGDIRML